MNRTISTSAAAATCLLMAALLWSRAHDQRAERKPLARDEAPPEPLHERSEPARLAAQATPSAIAPEPSGEAPRPELDPAAGKRAQRFFAEAFEKHQIKPVHQEVSCYPHVCRGYFAFSSITELAKLERIPRDSERRVEIGQMQRYGRDGYAIPIFFLPFPEP